ncbi:MAG: hypothetical protein QOG92_1630 [Verrucomicrobiota bacterium]|jgi:hypothetical protein|nr:hypothetical protein [Verrucomicrobiota bacterium]MEA3205944.1 hypothetical protein [Verrucomicrobiota bacterium]
MQSAAIMVDKTSMNRQVAEGSLEPREKVQEKLRSGVPAFKEWAIVCASIERGETSLIFRKGGIAEGPKGFRFQHRSFYLFPTYFHEQIERTRLSGERDLAPVKNELSIAVFVEVEFSIFCRDLKLVQALETLHVLQPSVLEERFHWDKQEGLHVAFLRAFRVSPSWELPLRPSYGGCRSWVTLPEPPSSLTKEPVLTDEEQNRRRSLVVSVSGQLSESED